MTARHRILLVDDHALVRRGVRLILEQEPDLEVVGEAGDGAEALTLLRDLAVDLVVLDIAMPRMTGLQAAREIARRRDPPKVLMLSMHDNEQYFFESLRVGASGYVLKSVADEDLVSACRAALRGEAFVYPGAMSTLVRDYLDRQRRGERVPETVLTAREDQVLKLIAEGSSTREIARRRDPPKVLMLSMHDNEQYFFESLRVGASGYVLKSVADRDLVEACRAAMRGEPFIYPDALTALMREYLQRARRGERLPGSILTARESEIVKLIAEGRSSKEIAALLVISVKTVERHRANILQKLEMRDRTELTRYALRTGLIES